MEVFGLGHMVKLLPGGGAHGGRGRAGEGDAAVGDRAECLVDLDLRRHRSQSHSFSILPRDILCLQPLGRAWASSFYGV